MTPLRAKYIRDLVIHGRSKHTQFDCCRAAQKAKRPWRDGSGVKIANLGDYPQLGWHALDQPSIYAVAHYGRLPAAPALKIDAISAPLSARL